MLFIMTFLIYNFLNLISLILKFINYLILIFLNFMIFFIAKIDLLIMINFYFKKIIWYKYCFNKNLFDYLNFIIMIIIEYYVCITIILDNGFCVYFIILIFILMNT
jgi:hypothetical protein